MLTEPTQKSWFLTILDTVFPSYYVFFSVPNDIIYFNVALLLCISESYEFLRTRKILDCWFVSPFINQKKKDTENEWRKAIPSTLTKIKTVGITKKKNSEGHTSSSLSRYKVTAQVTPIVARFNNESKDAILILLIAFWLTKKNNYPLGHRDLAIDPKYSTK